MKRSSLKDAGLASEYTAEDWSQQTLSTVLGLSDLVDNAPTRWSKFGVELLRRQISVLVPDSAWTCKFFLAVSSGGHRSIISRAVDDSIAAASTNRANSRGTI